MIELTAATHPRESNGSWSLVLDKTGPSDPPGWNDDC